LEEVTAVKLKSAKKQRTAPLRTPSGLGAEGTRDISGALNAVLADMFAFEASRPGDSPGR
jgi:hypothetical protein